MILFTPPNDIEGEEALINHLFELGLNGLHLRKPDYSKEEMMNYLHAIAPKHWSKIMIHNHLDLQNLFSLKGIHFNEKNKMLFEKFRSEAGQKSWALHHLDELEKIPLDIDYTILSPIFPSISKSGYNVDWNFEELTIKLKTRQNHATKVCALGGIDFEGAVKCKQLGFDDFAVLGAIWEPFMRSKDAQLTTDIFLQMNSL